MMKVNTKAPKYKETSSKLQSMLDSCALHRAKADENECSCKEYWTSENEECLHTRFLDKYRGLYTDYGHGACVRVNEFALAQRLADVDHHRHTAVTLDDWLAKDHIEQPHLPSRTRIRAAIHQVQSADYLEIAG